jgi:hypothetical protein
MSVELDKYLGRATPEERAKRQAAKHVRAARKRQGKALRKSLIPILQRMK